MRINDGSDQTKEEYELEQIALSKEHEENKAFIAECVATRLLMNTLHPMDLGIIDAYVKIEDFTIMYDQMLERLADEYGIEIPEKSDCDLPF